MGLKVTIKQLNIIDNETGAGKLTTVMAGPFNRACIQGMFVLIVSIFQVISVWYFQGKKVDESELVLFGVGFLGGDFDPVWNHYGHFGMYLLGGVYYCIGVVTVLFGKYDSLLDYAAHFTFDGTFFQLGRYIFAVCLTTAIFLLSKVVSQNASSRWLAPDISRIYYGSFGEKAEKIWEFHLQALGVWFCVLSMLSLIGVFIARYRKIVLYGWLVVFILLLPYWFGSTLRDYWFIPTYLFLGFLATITISILSEIIIKGARRKAIGIFVTGAIILLFGVKIFDGSAVYGSLLKRSMNTVSSNKDLAGDWLKSTHFGKHTIFVDRSYAWVYPTLYDPNNLSMSRYFSLMFIYERSENRFLSAVFEHYLYGQYLVANPSVKDEAVKISGLRVDFNNGITELNSPSLCSRFSKRCEQATVREIHDAEILKGDGASIQYQSTGEDPYVVYSIDAHVPTDGAFYVDIDTDAIWWELRYDLGDGYPLDFEPIKHIGSKKMPIKLQSKTQLGKYDMSNTLVAEKILNSKALFVTADGPFNRYKHLRKKSVNTLSEHDKA
ncbi:MAG: hypothetical protein ACI9SP_002490 [Arenicella sp.]